jgi:uroporphyrin-III C-methyltransferase/precorrin-2 dehydrogenase/sirohydrochlorin ferrochelatase
MVSLAKAGKRVVRLKGGDPMIFGRANEEIGALREAGIDFEIIPGISAAQGAAASLQVSLTDRGGARRLQLVTGHASNGTLPDDLDLAALADPGSTTAVYMPLGTLPSLVERLTAAGVEHQRPAIAIFNATRADELVVAGTIATISDDVERRRAAGPCVLLVGNALGAADAGAKIDPSTGQGAPLGSTPRPRLHLRDRHRPVAPALRGADQAARPGRQSR